ncbi:MAG TPA: PVC-type heme-binding CxxCH protein, partial [Flavitalea sp.]|nr:PVC-type heme-binding CxxCH protein [Flavitalea sp.]
GRLYVVEMHGYPLDKSGTGVIRLLSDTTGDGQMDKSIVFADGLTLPSSIMRWKQGVLITDAPNVLYFADTTGDGRTDIRDTMLTGFALSNPQHNLNSPVYNIDNWIYLAHEGTVGTETYEKEFGDEGTEIYYPGKVNGPRLARNASGRSVRFRPDQYLLEETSSKTQFGHAFDSWGRHFLVSNANHIIQEVVAANYLKRNPNLLVSDATHSLSDHANAAEVFPITRNPQNQLLTDIGVITSACGITSYQGSAFPSPYDSACFVAEPVSNLVHVDKLKDAGATFVANRILPNKEFLASTDAWFRPVNMYTGPDGALYVVDYYRQIIEHPEWMGEEVIKSGALYNGHDKGRIYRITTTNAPPADWTKELSLGKSTNEQLVEYLSHPNIWWRLNAQRLLLDRIDKNIVPSLVKMAQNRGAPFGRLHALWTLEGLQALTPELIVSALKDPVAGVRENAIRLAELHLNSKSVTDTLLELQDDPDAKVRYQLLCAVGSVNNPEALAVRNKLLFRDINDQWIQVAALSGSSLQTMSLLNIVLDSFRTGIPAYGSMVKRLGAMMASDTKSATVHKLIQTATSTQNSEWQAPLLEGLAQGLKNQKGSTASKTDQDVLVKTFFDHPSPAVSNASLSLLKAMELPDKVSKKQAIQKAVSIAVDQKQPEQKRVQAIQFISLDNPALYRDTLHGLIVPREPASIQSASIRTLNIINDTSLSLYLLQQWAALSPGVQDEAMNTFLKDTTRIALLLDAMEKGKVQPGAVGWQRSVRLMNHSNIPLRTRARKLLSQTDQERLAVNKEYQQALTLEGDPAKGKRVYMKNCGICHQVRGQSGNNFGPDLGSIHNWSRDAIMVNILAPNLSISSGYAMWEVQQKNGDTFQGIISSETPTAITLKNQSLEQRTITRADITSLKAINISAMPTGLEKQITQQQMADLLAFLKQVDR